MAFCQRIRNAVDRGREGLDRVGGLVPAPSIGGGRRPGRGGRNGVLGPDRGGLDLEADGDLHRGIVSDCVDLCRDGDLGSGKGPDRGHIRRPVNVDLRNDGDRRLRDLRNRDLNLKPDVSHDPSRNHVVSLVLNQNHVVSRVLNRKPDISQDLNRNLDVSHDLNRNPDVSLVLSRNLGDSLVPSRSLVTSLVPYRNLVVDLDRCRIDRVGQKVEDLLKKPRGQYLRRNDRSPSRQIDFAASNFGLLSGISLFSV